MSLTSTDIARIANLARLELQPSESERMLTQMNDFFAIVEQMRAVDTAGIEPLAHPAAVLQDVALRLREYAATVGGREQLAIEAFATAMEIIPWALAENAGLDAIDMVIQLKSAHEKKGAASKNMGLDLDAGKPVDMLKANVIEPLRVKIQAIQSATDAACLILRIDDVLASIEVATRFGVPLLPRGGGSSLAGQTVGAALVMDFSKYVSHILDLDVEGQTVTVEPGINVNALNMQLRPTGLMFGPDPASAERATAGGIVGNNSTGSHSSASVRSTSRCCGRCSMARPAIAPRPRPAPAPRDSPGPKSEY